MPSAQSSCDAQEVLQQPDHIREAIQGLLGTEGCARWLDSASRIWPEEHASITEPVGRSGRAWLASERKPERSSQLALDSNAAYRLGCSQHQLAKAAAALAGQQISGEKLMLIQDAPENALLAMAGQLKALELPWDATAAQLCTLQTLSQKIGLESGIQLAKWAIDSRPEDLEWVNDGSPLTLSGRLAQATLGWAGWWCGLQELQDLQANIKFSRMTSGSELMNGKQLESAIYGGAEELQQKIQGQRGTARWRANDGIALASWGRWPNQDGSASGRVAALVIHHPAKSTPKLWMGFPHEL